MKTLLDEYRWGAIHKGIFTLEEAIEKLKNDNDNRENSSFRIENKGIIINTCDQGNVFYVTKYKEDNPSFSTMFDTYRDTHNFADLGELISNYSDDKMSSFEKAEDYGIKMLIENLSENEKDAALFSLIKSKST